MFSGDMENLPPEYRWDLNTLETAFREWGKNADAARRAAENLRKALEGPQEEFRPKVGPEFEEFLQRREDIPTVPAPDSLYKAIGKEGGNGRYEPYEPPVGNSTRGLREEEKGIEDL